MEEDEEEDEEVEEERVEEDEAEEEVEEQAYRARGESWRNKSCLLEGKKKRQASKEEVVGNIRGGSEGENREESSERMREQKDRKWRK